MWPKRQCVHERLNFKAKDFAKECLGGSVAGIEGALEFDRNV